MSKTKVKKALDALSKEELLECVMEMYVASKDAKLYLDFWADPDIEKTFEKAEKKLFTLFFHPNNEPKRAPRMGKLKEIIKDFTSLVKEPEEEARLRTSALTYAAQWIEANDRHLSNSTTLRKFLADSLTFSASVALLPVTEKNLSHSAEILKKVLDTDASARRRSYYGWYFPHK
ncbi:MAG: hypothetical protein HDS43_03105 [Bacteroides sp.]|nr:hypothetical protein [Bacteroides sp.]